MLVVLRLEVQCVLFMRLNFVKNSITVSDTSIHILTILILFTP